MNIENTFIMENLLDLNFPILLKVPKHYTHAEKSKAVKDDGGQNRWTWEV